MALMHILNKGANNVLRIIIKPFAIRRGSNPSRIFNELKLQALHRICLVITQCFSFKITCPESENDIVTSPRKLAFYLNEAPFCRLHVPI